MVTPLGAELNADALLTLWESALDQSAATRADALLGAAWSNASGAGTLGERNARLVALHERLFGGEMELLSRCPACGTVAELTADCAALSTAIPAASSTPSSTHILETDGHRVEFRLPDGGDVAAAASAGEAGEFALRLLDRCVLACARGGAHVGVRELPAAVLDGISRRIESLDPGASVSFALTCPHCAAGWSAPLDVGQLVWEKVRAAAEGLLLDVDALARSYGWTEAEVLRLSPLRRAAYLQLVSA